MGTKNGQKMRWKRNVAVFSIDSSKFQDLEVREAWKNEERGKFIITKKKLVQQLTTFILNSKINI